MKKLFLIFLILPLLFSCQSKENTNFDFILGTWKRVNESPGKETFEKWEKLNDSTYQGLGYTMQNQAVISSEHVILSKLNNKWSYQVTLSNENTSTNFELVDFNSNSFTSRNEKNDFPKVIKYWKEGDKLLAEISAESKKEEFQFELVKN